MNRTISLLAAASIATMMTGTAFAQNGGDPRVNGTVVQGNTTVVFEKANGSDLDMRDIAAMEQVRAGTSEDRAPTRQPTKLARQRRLSRQASRSGQAVQRQSRYACPDEERSRQLCCQRSEIARITKELTHPDLWRANRAWHLTARPRRNQPAAVPPPT